MTVTYNYMGTLEQTKITKIDICKEIFMCEHYASLYWDLDVLRVIEYVKRNMNCVRAYTKYGPYVCVCWMVGLFHADYTHSFLLLHALPSADADYSIFIFNNIRPSPEALISI